MTDARLKTEIRVAAQLRRAQAAGAFATVVRRGDADAGAVAVKVYLGGGRARLFTQSRNLEGAVCWSERFVSPDNEPNENEIDDWLIKERRIDPDLWVIEVEDRDGRAFLEES